MNNYHNIVAPVRQPMTLNELTRNTIDDGLYTAPITTPRPGSAQLNQQVPPTNQNPTLSQGSGGSGGIQQPDIVLNDIILPSPPGHGGTPAQPTTATQNPSTGNTNTVDNSNGDVPAAATETKGMTDGRKKIILVGIGIALATTAAIAIARKK